MPPLLANFIHARGCKPICAKLLTLPDIETVKDDCIGIGLDMGLALDSSLTPSNSTWWKPVTASQNNQGEVLKQSLERYITFHTVENLGAYGIDEITAFNIYCEARGNGSYSIYFLFA